MRTLLTLSLIAAFAGFNAGCGSDTEPQGDDGTTQPPVVEYDETTGQQAHAPKAYAAGPYGQEIGATVANIRYLGFPDPSVDRGNAYPMEFADFYNPTGSDVYEAGSVFEEGSPKPKALLVIVSAGWCQPCQYENRYYLPGDYEEYHPQGVQFLLQMADGPYLGTPAVFTDLAKWTETYDTAWPSVIDPINKSNPLWAMDAFPANMIIDTRTMKLVKAIAGVPLAKHTECAPADCTPGNVNCPCYEDGSKCEQNECTTPYWDALDEVLAN